jgi:hypothetical protein
VDVSITPLETTNSSHEFAADRQFQDARNQLELLSVMFCARKA